PHSVKRFPYSGGRSSLRCGDAGYGRFGGRHQRRKAGAARRRRERKERQMRPSLGLFALLAGVAASTTLLMGGAASAAGNIEIKVLSSRADLISGGDALVEVVLPTGVRASRI